MIDLNYCFTCGNKGLLNKVCPECGHPKVSDTLSRLDKINNFDDLGAKTTDSISDTDSFKLIPDCYDGVFWSRKKIENDYTEKLPEKFDIPNASNDRLFVHFLDQLSKINNIFRQGGIPNKSVYIIAPPGYSKTIFAYSCMQYALANNYSVAPMIDTIELKRLLILAAENLNYKLYDKFSYDEYLTSEVVFITVTHTYYRYDAYSVLEEIINRRSRLGLSTFIISRYSLNTLYKWDKFNTLDSLKNSNSKDCRKYPAVVMYTDLHNGLRR